MQGLHVDTGDLNEMEMRKDSVEVHEVWHSCLFVFLIKKSCIKNPWHWFFTYGWYNWILLDWYVCLMAVESRFDKKPDLLF